VLTAPKYTFLQDTKQDAENKDIASATQPAVSSIYVYVDPLRLYQADSKMMLH
jgi:hypothetical protein